MSLKIIVNKQTDCWTQNVNANCEGSPCRNLAGSQDKIVTCVYNSGTRDQRGLNIPPCEPLLPPYFTFSYPVTK